jgi:hypothetical protein
MADRLAAAATLRAAAPARPSQSGRRAGLSNSAFFPSSSSSSPARRLVGLRAAPSQVGVGTIGFRAVQDLRARMFWLLTCVFGCVCDRRRPRRLGGAGQ